MKSKLSILLGLLVATCVAGFRDNSYASSNIAAESETLAAQVNVTRDAIGQLMAKLQNSTGAVARFSHPDFVTKSRQFNSVVEAAMVKFEATVANDVLKPASLWIDHLNSIEKDPKYANDQRQALLDSQYAQAKTAFKALSTKYRAAIYELYRVVLPQIEMQLVNYDAETRYCGNVSLYTDITRWKIKNCLERININLRVVSSDPRAGFTSIDFVRTYSPEGWRSQSPDEADSVAKGYVMSFYLMDPNHVPEARKAIYAQMVERDCLTSSCTALFASQLSAYLTLVKSSLDKSIPFKTTRLQYFSVNAVDATIERPMTIFREPAGTIALPFDISEQQYRQALVERTASTYASNTDSAAIENCATEGDRLKALACYSESGCLTDSEKEFVASAIHSGSGRDASKSKRIACLRN